MVIIIITIIMLAWKCVSDSGLRLDWRHESSFLVAFSRGHYGERRGNSPSLSESQPSTTATVYLISHQSKSRVWGIKFGLTHEASTDWLAVGFRPTTLTDGLAKAIESK